MSELDWAGLMAGDTSVCFEHPYVSVPTFEQFVETQLQVLGVLFNAGAGSLIPAALANAESVRYITPEGEIDLGDYVAALSITASQMRADRLFLPRVTRAAVADVAEPEGSAQLPVAVSPDDPRMALAEPSLLWFAMERRGDRRVTVTGLYPIRWNRTYGNTLVMTRQAITMFAGILP